MFILKKIISPWILPPGVFILLLILYGGWLRFRVKRRGWAIPILLGCLLWFFSTSIVSDGMIRLLESDFYHTPAPHGDVIILLGGGIVQRAPDLTGVGRPTDVMCGRIVTAVRLQQRLNLPVIVTGGKGFKSENPEAPVVKRILTDLGVPEKSIIIEDKASDTMENAINSKKLCMQNGFTTPILITSACHMKRSLLSFKNAGLEVAPYPAGFITSPHNQFHWFELFPSGSNLYLSSRASHEYLGLLFYKLFY